jgi:leucine-zipper-like transcriptional regulator 1
MKKTMLLLLLPALITLASCTKAVDPTFPAAQNTPVPGSIWTETSRAAAFDPRYSQASVVYDNAMWVIGGARSSGAQANDVWYSMDGTYWQEATAGAAFDARQGHTCVVYDFGKDFGGIQMCVIGGYGNSTFYNDVWCSSNGKDWVEKTPSAGFSPRCGHSCVVYDDGTGPKIYVIGGHQGTTFYNDVWYSSDGINWTPKTNAGFTIRYNHTSVVFNNAIWVIGGISSISGNYVYENDVWSLSGSGGTWARATSTAAFSGRYLHASVVYDNKMWVIGGSDNIKEEYLNYKDAWYSTNGIDWIAATQNADFSPRDGLRAVIFNNAMYFTAGAITGSSIYYNDVWRSQ